MFKTFNDFVRLACRTYRLDFEKAEKFILLRLYELHLTKMSVVCYINWADGDTLTQKELAKILGVSQPTVNYHLRRLQEVWPHLFMFGPKVPPLKYMSKLPNGEL